MRPTLNTPFGGSMSLSTHNEIQKNGQIGSMIPVTPITLVPSATQNFRSLQMPAPAAHTPTYTVTQQTWESPTQILHLKENEVIFREGEMPNGLYFVKSGCVKVVVNRSLTRGRMNSPEYVMRVVGAGEFFGFKSLVKGTPNAFFAKTLKPTEVYVYPKEVITSIMNGPTSLIKTLLLQAVRDLEAYENISQLHYLASVQERIAYQLLLLADKFGVQTANGLQLNLRLTRNELAQLAGTINESLSRHLTEFKNEGIIDLSGKEILIKDREKLMMRSGNFKLN